MNSKDFEKKAEQRHNEKNLKISPKFKAFSENVPINIVRGKGPTMILPWCC